jgi:hypothetical protein
MATEAAIHSESLLSEAITASSVVKCTLALATYGAPSQTRFETSGNRVVAVLQSLAEEPAKFAILTSIQQGQHDRAGFNEQ